MTKARDSEYRNRTTGEVKTQEELSTANFHMSFPSVWQTDVFEALNIDPVLPSSPAATTKYQDSVRDGVEQNSNGDWVEKYVAHDMFADTTDDDGVTTTKAQHEAAYQATLDASVAESNRTKRSVLLSETDWTGMSDVTMTDAMTTYRQALRDITDHASWPNLDDAHWPTKP
tara:strand:- start:233 stop:748 length:516 start_codon:yes stop_codon:yes gene_type:complete